MPTRLYPKHTVSSSSPASPQAGDEWWNSSTNRLYKYTIVSGMSPQWMEVSQPSLITVTNTTTTKTTQTKTYNFVGSLSVSTGTIRWYADANIQLVSMMFAVSSVPSGGAASVSLRKNNVVIGTATIAVNQYYSSSVDLSAYALVAGDYLTVDVLSANGCSDGILSILYTR